MSTTTAPAPAPVIRVSLNLRLVRKLMRNEGVTQTYLAQRWGMSQPNVSQMFTGSKPLPYERLKDLAGLLRMKPELIADIRVEGGCPECAHCQAAARSAG